MQINAFVAQRGEFYRLLSASFLYHGPMHLLGNMLSLHWIAPDLERVVGKPLLLTLYAAGALGGGILHLTYGPMGSVLVGASGGPGGAGEINCKKHFLYFRGFFGRRYNRDVGRNNSLQMEESHVS